MDTNDKAPAARNDGEVKKDWRECANPLFVDILAQHYPLVKGSLRFELVGDEEETNG